jgi:hypothetical protein
LEDIKNAAKDSLEKFFILQKIVEILKLDINREKPGHLEIEQKLFEKMGKGHDHHHRDEHMTPSPKVDKHNEHHEHDHHHENQEHSERGHKESKGKKSSKK